VQAASLSYLDERRLYAIVPMDYSVSWFRSGKLISWSPRAFMVDAFKGYPVTSTDHDILWSHSAGCPIRHDAWTAAEPTG
jgi:hypothetical protein